MKERVQCCMLLPFLAPDGFGISRNDLSGSKEDLEQTFRAGLFFLGLGHVLFG